MKYVSTLRVTLVAGWREAWKWSSVRFLAAGAACQGAVILTPDRVAAHVPDFVMQGLSTVAILCTVAAGFGRVTVVEKTHVPEPPKPTADNAGP